MLRAAFRAVADSSRRWRRTRRHAARWAMTVGIALAGLPLAAATLTGGETRVHVGRLEGVVGPIGAAYLQKELARAASAGAELFVLELDTPGGLDAAMRSMVQAILASPVPVAVYVCPAGAHAASAGLFLLEAAHVAAMAPATNTGAAHPVAFGARMDSTMAAKATNDAVAYIRAIATRRGRNADWCERAVRESASAPVEEALKLGVADLMAADLKALLAACDGRRVETIDGERALRTADAVVVRRLAGWRARFLQHLTDPTLAYLLLLFGFYGLIFELTHPGAIVPGVVGALCLLLAFLAFQNLPVNSVGLLLLLLGLGLLLLEVKVTSHGVLAVGGATALALGSLLLFDASSPFGALSLWVIVPAVTATVLFFLLIISLGIAAQRRRRRTGAEALVGSLGEVLSEDGPVAGGYAVRVALAGEIWAARTSLPLRRGTRVTVKDRDGRVLLVEATDGAGKPAPTS